ncbi:hypothetical protein [Streptomyces sp. NPDC018059]
MGRTSARAARWKAASGSGPPASVASGLAQGGEAFDGEIAAAR